jgi:hypothetical protein
MTGPIVITGMHRSGTSLLASMLDAAGVHLGDRLLTPGPGSRQGAFEDLDFIDLHDEMLAALGTSLYLERPLRGAVPAALRARAESLVAARADRSLWGWKDPRTVLFLDLWQEIVPEAHVIFVHRPPAEVVSSLRRRRDAPLFLRFPGAALLERWGMPRFRAAHALHMWCTYNARIVAFVEDHRDRCAVVRHDRLARDVPGILDRFRAAGWPLHEVDVSTRVDPALAGLPAEPADTRRWHRDENAAGILARLDAIADAE